MKPVKYLVFKNVNGASIVIVTGLVKLEDDIFWSGETNLLFRYSELAITSAC